MRKSRKFTAIIAAFIMAVFAALPTSALTVSTNNGTVTEIEYLDDGYYVETILEDAVPDISTVQTQSTKTITKSKTTYIKNSSGDVMWSVRITATFSYNGISATCTNCSHSTTSPGTNWSIVSASHSKSGNSATATAKALHSGAGGIKNYFTRSVTITCSANGTVS